MPKITQYCCCNHYVTCYLTHNNARLVCFNIALNWIQLLLDILSSFPGMHPALNKLTAISNQSARTALTAQTYYDNPRVKEDRRSEQC